jgi:predicted RNA-binding Zn-ribbon protein involved in translation (DUF1610 family)
MNTNRICGRSSLDGMGWRATASSRPGRFQATRNASRESLSRGAIFEHRPGGGPHKRTCYYLISRMISERVVPMASYQHCRSGRGLRIDVEIKCPDCGGEHVRPCTRLDEYGREWIDNFCETCGHKLGLEEIGRHVVTVPWAISCAPLRPGT